MFTPRNQIFDAGEHMIQWEDTQSCLAAQKVFLLFKTLKPAEMYSF